jgi:hypothetical protein
LELLTLARRWFPGETVTTELLGEVIFLEKRELEKMEIAVNNGIAKAFKG